MNTTMMVIGMLLIGNIGFVLGAWYSSRKADAKVQNMKVEVDSIIHSLQMKLITEKDNRGFQTRTHVSAWLKKMGPEVHEEFYSGANYGRKTI